MLTNASPESRSVRFQTLGTLGSQSREDASKIAFGSIDELSFQALQFISFRNSSRLNGESQEFGLAVQWYQSYARTLLAALVGC